MPGQQDDEQQAAAPDAAPPPAPPGDDMSSKIDQLKQLSDLKAQGALTEEEFAERKRQILG
jgi:hypothetical protein